MNKSRRGGVLAARTATVIRFTIRRADRRGRARPCRGKGGLKASSKKKKLANIKTGALFYTKCDFYGGTPASVARCGRAGASAVPRGRSAPPASLVCSAAGRGRGRVQVAASPRRPPEYRRYAECAAILCARSGTHDRRPAARGSYLSVDCRRRYPRFRYNRAREFWSKRSTATPRGRCCSSMH